MKTIPQKRTLTFGDLITAVYDACGKRQAKGIVRLAVNARLVEFRGHDQIVISAGPQTRPRIA